MAKKKAAARESVWLQCTECNDLNYRTSVNVKGGMPEKMKEGIKKYSPRLRKHTLHKSQAEVNAAPCEPRGRNIGTPVAQLGRAADSKSAG